MAISAARVARRQKGRKDAAPAPLYQDETGTKMTVLVFVVDVDVVPGCSSEETLRPNLRVVLATKRKGPLAQPFWARPRRLNPRKTTPLSVTDCRLLRQKVLPIRLSPSHSSEFLLFF